MQTWQSRPWPCEPSLLGALIQAGHLERLVNRICAIGALVDDLAGADVPDGQQRDGDVLRRDEIHPQSAAFLPSHNPHHEPRVCACADMWQRLTAALDWRWTWQGRREETEMKIFGQKRRFSECTVSAASKTRFASSLNGSSWGLRAASRPPRRLPESTST